MDSKRKRVDIPVALKREICLFKEENPKLTREAIIKHFSKEKNIIIGRSTLSDILRSKDKWMNTSEEIGNHIRIRHLKHAEMERALYLWIRQMTSSNSYISDKIIISKARELGEQHGVTELSYSSGWLQRFKNRFGMLVKVKGMQKNSTHAEHNQMVEWKSHISNVHELARMFSLASEPEINIIEIDRVVCNTYAEDEKMKLLHIAKSVIPPLLPNLHKGLAGRIGVIGGSFEYTGAPYFAAISSLKVGADLSHVFCASSSATVIKSYSPELIVHPLLDDVHCVEKIAEWLPRLHSIVIGPGLGRDPQIMETVKSIIKVVKQQNIPVVFDADGLFLLKNNINEVMGYEKAILTPNIMEFKGLYEAVRGKQESYHDINDKVKTLSQDLGNVTVLCKGNVDIISNGKIVITCDEEGSSRRCGGQGDLLSGSLGTFNYWAHYSASRHDKHEGLKEYGPAVIAAYMASSITKKCNNLAFKEYGRSTLTTNMIEKIDKAFTLLFETDHVV